MKKPFLMISSWVTAVSALFFAAFVSGAPQPSSPLIAASSDLSLVMPKIIDLFQRSGGGHVQVIYDSPEALYQRIAKGEPVQLLLAGEEDVAKRLVNEGKTQDIGTLYAIGRLAFYAPRQRNLTSDAMLSSFLNLVGKNQIKKIVIPNPEFSPYGREVESLLRTKFAVWENVSPALRLAPTTSSAMRTTIYDNSVQGAFIAYSHARQLVSERGGRASPLSAELAAPIPQRMVLMSDAGKTAKLFYAFMQSTRVKRLLLAYDFNLPSGETLATLIE